MILKLKNKPVNKNIFKQNNLEENMDKRSGAFLKDIKGQGLSTNAIILMVLGVVVLAVLVVGFFFGWQTLLPWIQQDNVDTIISQCQVACTTGNTYAFCGQERTLRAGGKEVPATCYELSTNSSYAIYGIDSCPQLESECAKLLEGTEEPEEGTE